jgi:predicted MarR family transcription regulator
MRHVSDANYLVRWIIRDMPIAGSQRSPNLTPLDIFLWYYVKEVLCTKTVADLQNILNILEKHLKSHAK